MERNEELGMSKGKSSLTEAFENFAGAFTNFRELLHKHNPGKETEIDEKLTECLNHPANPLKQIQKANFNSVLPENGIKTTEKL